MRHTCIALIILWLAGCPGANDRPISPVSQPEVSNADGTGDPAVEDGAAVPGDEPATPSNDQKETPLTEVRQPLDEASRKKFIAEMREMGVSVELDDEERVVSLVMGFTEIDDEGLAKLPPLPHLEFLSIDHTNVTDKGLRAIAGRTSLQALQMGGNKFTADGVKHLAGLTKLEYLDLSDLPIGDDALPHLANLKSLTELNLNKTDVTLAGTIEFAKTIPDLKVRAPFGNLVGGQRLTMRPGASDEDLAQLKPLGSLRELNLWECEGITDAGMEHVIALDQLTSLELGYTKVTDAGLAKLAALKNLKQLDVRDTEITIAGTLKLVAALPQLHVLANWGTVDGATTLSFNPDATDEQLQQLIHLPNLQRLNLWRCDQLTDEGIAHVVKSPHLRELNLGATNITYEGVQNLTALENLERLVLANTQISEKGLSEIGKMVTLQELDLSSTATTDKDINALHTLSALQSLNLAGTPITDAALPKFGPLQALRQIDLSQTQVGGGAGALVNLGRLPELQSVDLSLTLTSDVEVAYLAKCQNIQELDLWGTRVTDEGLRQLQEMKQLKRLGLFGTEVSEEAVAGLKKQMPELEVTLDFADERE